MGQKLLLGLQRRLLEIALQWVSLISFSAPTGGVNFLFRQWSLLSNQSSAPEDGFDWVGPCLVWVLGETDGTFRSGLWRECDEKGCLLKSELCRRNNKGKGRERFKEPGASCCCRNDCPTRLVAGGEETRPLPGSRATGGSLGNKYPNISLLLLFHLLLQAFHHYLPLAESERKLVGKRAWLMPSTEVQHRGPQGRVEKGRE